jgi:hypothetical protein
MTDESPVDRLIPARHIEIKRALCGEGSTAVSPSRRSRIVMGRRVYSMAR